MKNLIRGLESVKIPFGRKDYARTAIRVLLAVAIAPATVSAGNSLGDHHGNHSIVQ